MYKFILEYAQEDPTGHYITNWMYENQITVYAETLNEAIEKAKKVLGEPKPGRIWAFDVKLIQEVEQNEKTTD